jgi:hypothetical protein
MEFLGLGGVDGSGRYVRVPTDFGPGPTLVLLVDREATAAVDAWLPLARRLAAGDSPVGSVVAVIGERDGDTGTGTGTGTGSPPAGTAAPPSSGRPFAGAHVPVASLTGTAAEVAARTGLDVGLGLHAVLFVEREVVWLATGTPTPGLERSLLAVVADAVGATAVADGSGVGRSREASGGTRPRRPGPDAESSADADRDGDSDPESGTGTGHEVG